MTLFSPMEKHRYISHGVGIGAHDLSQEEWNLAALTNRCLFGYENGQSVAKLASNFDPSLIQSVKDTIYQDLGGSMVRTFMRRKSPYDFYHELSLHKHDHLKVDIWHNGGMRGLVLARCLVWRGNLTPEERSFVNMHSQSYQ